MQEYDYQGNPAIRILVNGMDVGNLHTEDVTFVKENQERILGIKDLQSQSIMMNTKIKTAIQHIQPSIMLRLNLS